MGSFNIIRVVIAWMVISLIILLSTLKWPNIDFSREKLIPEHAPNFTSSPKQLRLDGQHNHLFWFVQISDIYIGTDSEAGRIAGSNFAGFVSETLNTIKPSVVLASGDLTNSAQNETGWQIYSKLLTKGNVRNKTLWLDLRGERDISEPSMKNNTFYERYSVQGSQHKRSYMKLIQHNADLYSFIAVDASPELRLKLPFNDFGMLTERDQDELNKLQEESRTAGADYTIWFGHYPTSYVVTPREGTDGLRRMISNHENSLAYMCGHLGDFNGWIPRMYTLQDDSFLELEVADWMHNRKFRVVAIDNGLLSFVDVRHGDWPIVLITNPKYSLMQLPYRQEAKLQLESTHIRLLAFSPAGIKSCVVQIDDDCEVECTSVNDNLFVVKWNPKKYKDGIHYITATVVDDNGVKGRVKQPFRLDNKQSFSFDYLARIILETGGSVIFKCAFYVAISVYIVPFIALRIWHQLIIAGFLSPRKISGPEFGISSLLISSTIDRIFWPIVLYSIYVVIGPWGICEVFDGEYGVLFIWGVYINGTSLPDSRNYLFAALSINLCILLLSFLSIIIEKQFGRVFGWQTYHELMHRRHCRIFFCITLSFQIFSWYYFKINFGYSIWLGPFILWPIITSFSLLRFAQNVPEELLKPAVYAWSGRVEPTTVSLLNPNIIKRKIDRIRRKLWFCVAQEETVIRIESGAKPGA